MRTLRQRIACFLGFHPSGQAMLSRPFYINGTGPFVVASCRSCDSVLYLEDQNTFVRYRSYGHWLDESDADRIRAKIRAKTERAR